MALVFFKATGRDLERIINPLCSLFHPRLFDSLLIARQPTQINKCFYVFPPFFGFMNSMGFEGSLGSRNVNMTVLSSLKSTGLVT